MRLSKVKRRVFESKIETESVCEVRCGLCVRKLTVHGTYPEPFMDMALKLGWRVVFNANSMTHEVICPDHPGVPT